MNDHRHSELNPLDDPRIACLYRETCDAEPPDWLDQRILSAARTALDRQPTSAIPLPKQRRNRIWTLPLALAATVVLAVGLIRLLPPANEISRMPAALEEKAARSLAKPVVAEKDAPLAKSADSTKADQANQSVSPPAAATPRAPAMELPQHPSPTLSGQGDQPAAHQQAGTEALDRVKWLAEIAELRRQGRHAEAEASLTAFRRVHPATAEQPLR